MSDAIDYEEKVRAVYPEAYYKNVYGRLLSHEILIPPTRISDLVSTEQDAWKSAYDQLVKEGIYE